MSKNYDIRTKVEARAKAEREAKNNKSKDLNSKKSEITDDELKGYLNENRAGDAKLYCRLFRGQVVYVKYWERFLIWGGHHWIEEDYEEAKQNIEDICDLYLRLADNLQAKADEETDKTRKGAIQNMVDTVIRRVNQLRDIPGQDKLMQMIRRIRDPLVILPKHIDKQHYLKACPNGVIDLRTGELHPGKPEQYILNSIATEYDPALDRKSVV